MQQAQADLEQAKVGLAKLETYPELARLQPLYQALLQARGQQEQAELKLQQWQQQYQPLGWTLNNKAADRSGNTAKQG